jgi:hypothetical protein
MFLMFVMGHGLAAGGQNIVIFKYQGSVVELVIKLII